MKRLFSHTDLQQLSIQRWRKDEVAQFKEWTHGLPKFSSGVHYLMKNNPPPAKGAGIDGGEPKRDTKG